MGEGQLKEVTEVQKGPLIETYLESSCLFLTALSPRLQCASLLHNCA
jgi:hypothetical protein